jgi:hypothetical protein
MYASANPIGKQWTAYSFAGGTGLLYAELLAEFVRRIRKKGLH